MPPDPRYLAVQKAVYKTIDDPSFSASLPPLSEAAWLKILEAGDFARSQNDRLEFMGDALMYATLGRQLYKQIPEGTAGLYTTTRAVLQANATFSRLSEKFDILAVSKKVLDALTRRTFGEGSKAPEKSPPQMKATGDLFETVIGAYYLERGFESLSEWVGELFAPLIATAREAYMNSISEKTRRRLLATRLQGSLGLLTQKPRLRSGSCRRTRSHMQPPPVPKSPVHSPIKARLLALARSPFVRAHRKASPSPSRPVTPRLPLALRITTPKRPQLKPKPIFIDLTGLSDDEEAPSFSTKASGKSSQVQAAGAKAGKLPSNGSRSIPREERKGDGLRLERMLLSNNSDMDLASSDSGSD